MPEPHSTKKRAQSSRTKRPTRTPRKRGETEGDHVETWDLVAVAERHERNAELVKSLFERDGPPDWLTGLVLRGLELATEKTGVKHYDEAKGDFDLRGLADLLAVTDEGKFEELLEFEPKKDLAELVSAVLKHPDLPTDVYNSFSGALTDLFFDTDSPAYIRLLLEGHTKKEGGE